MSALDADLVERVLAGERQAFEGLVRSHYPRALAVAHGVLGADPAADDVVQESFLKAYEQLGALSEPAAFPAWLMRIVRNEAITWHRRHRRRGVRLDDAPPLAAREPETDGHEGERLARRQALRQALPRLKASYREILTLKYEAGLSYDELAESLGVSVANVEKRLYRARQALLRLLEAGPPPA